MTANEIRQSFLKFFENRGHTIVPSAPVIPRDDPSLLFTNAGMNQFKDVFLGKGKRNYVRAANAQKCIRVSGKHNDLEEVGRDTYHHTFFEMLGNWSFGDYYKKEAIAWAWELLTKEWKLDRRHLYATVFETDDEAEKLWKKVTDIDPRHVLRFGKKDNFWEMGETGPCGPCSEIHYDFTPDYSGGKLINRGDPRVMEIWNLVFIQYNCDESGNLSPLPAKHVDTGMGFERICAVLQGKESNYDTDLFKPLVDQIGKLAGQPYEAWLKDSPPQVDMRVLADHVRALTFAIADGALPSNEGRGYVLRRLLRRASRFGRDLLISGPVIHELVPTLAEIMGNSYPDIKAKEEFVQKVIHQEEEAFGRTLDRGIEIHQEEVRQCVLSGRRVFSGQVAFKLHDTYGFPIDLTQLMAREHGLEVEMETFGKLMEEQRERSRKPKPSATGIYIGSTGPTLAETKPIHSTFIGYEQLEVEIGEDDFDVKVGPNNSVEGIFPKQTPFYVEAGGQVSDTGSLLGNNFFFKIISTTRLGDQILHVLEPGAAWKEKSRLRLVVDKPRRLNIMRNHTATHVVHEALRRVLGTHAHQQGSLVAPDHLRFDFNHFDKISPEELKAIEEMVNEKIAESILVEAENDPTKWITIDEAKRRYPNVKMFFGDRYGEKVRIVVIDPKFSVELCGGTHVKNTKEIGLFKIISESSIASGIRRIEAVTGEGLQQYIERRLKEVGELDEHLAKLIEEKESLEKELNNYTTVKPSPRPSLGTITLPSQSDFHALQIIESAEKNRKAAVEQVAKHTSDLKKALSKHRVKQATSSVDQLLSTAVPLNGFKVISAKVDAQTMDELKSIGDALRAKLGSGVGVLASVVDNKVALVCVVTDDLIKSKNLQAGKIVGEIAKGVGGSGGGRPHLATAGGKDVSKLDETLQQARAIIHNMLKN